MIFFMLTPMMSLRSVLADQNRGSAFPGAPDAKPDCVSSGIRDRLPRAARPSIEGYRLRFTNLDCVCGRADTFVCTIVMASLLIVMPGLVPGIHVLSLVHGRTWMAGTSPAMTM
jgi:hypothetical protein